MDIKKENERNNIKYDKYGYRVEDFENYKPKKYYIKADDEDKLETKLKQQENELKKFKYSEETPRFITYYLQKIIFLNIIYRISSHQYSGGLRYSRFEICFFLSASLSIISHSAYFENYYGYFWRL